MGPLCTLLSIADKVREDICPLPRRPLQRLRDLFRLLPLGAAVPLPALRREVRRHLGEHQGIVMTLFKSKTCRIYFILHLYIISRLMKEERNNYDELHSMKVSTLTAE